MATVFWRQYKALTFKNIVIIRRHWLLNLLRCLILPIAYGIFLAFAPTFFSERNDVGIGSAIPIFHLEDHYNGKSPIVWVDATGGTGYLQASAIMDHVTANFTERQRAGVTQAKDDDELLSKCISNLNNASPCFIAISFNHIPTSSSADNSSFNYTIRADYGAYRIDVGKHTSDFETKVVPTQWAIDSAITELTTGKQTPQILQMPYTHETNANTDTSSRIFFLALMGSFGGVTFLLALTGITYQLAGGLALERASLLTSHMQAMGALDSSRILSWYTTIVALYLPTWIILGGIWKARLFVETNTGLLVLTTIITGLGLASFSCIVSVPFSKSPQLAAVVATGAAIVLAVVPLAIDETTNTIAPPVLSFFFPSMFFVFMIKDFSGFEIETLPGDINTRDPTYNFLGTPMVITAAIAIVFWPCVAVYWERWMYGVSNPSSSESWWSRKSSTTGPYSLTGISLRNLQKKFNSSMFRRKSRDVVAVADLTLDIPSYGIFVLLGANGAGKSTTLSILGGLTKASGGSVTFSGSEARPPRGTIGIVPQKNVLFPELSCLQTLRLWNAIKADGYQSEEEIQQLIRDCDLQSKMHEPAGTLSGGQKRKLQLAIGLVGGSKIILVDECTSGVDPLSRRALWRTLTAYREERTIILTTHFLDEADFLADRIAVLAAPGKLIAADTPVALKSTMGEGYTITVRSHSDNASRVLDAIRAVAPDTTMTFPDTDAVSYHLKIKDTSTTAAALRLIENGKAEYGISSYDVSGTTIEDIFLDLVAQDELEAREPAMKQLESTTTPYTEKAAFTLSSGKVRSSWEQALTIFYKRVLIARRSWLPPLLALAVGISGAWWPIRFITGSVASCAHVAPQSDVFFTNWPPFINNNTVPVSPPVLIQQINASLPELFVYPFVRFDPLGTSPQDIPPYNPFFTVPDKQALLDYVNANYLNFTADGALFMDFDKNDFLLAYSIGPSALSYFSIASNLFFAHALNESTGVTTGSRKIIASFLDLPAVSDESLLTLEWLAVFGAAMVVFPAFFSIYIAKERHSSVQAMQLSNGLSNPLGLWLGHLLFDSMFTVIIASVIAIVYSVVRHKFQGIGYLWLIMCLYGFASTLFAYIVAIGVKSPLGAFALVVISQFFIYLLYLTGYIVTFFSGNPQTIQHTFTIIYFTTALAAPIISLVRAAMISTNQFSLACDGEHVARGTALGTIERFGGPILYLFIWILVLLFLLAKIDSGGKLRLWPPFGRFSRKTNTDGGGMSSKAAADDDVANEVDQALSFSNTDPLRVLNVSKYFGKNKAVDDVTFTIPQNSVFVMLGPNGAGKTTTLDIIRGSLTPDSGDVLVKGTSTLTDIKKARLSFGVCPQFTAMDAQLTVQEHLRIYGKLRGLTNAELDSDVAVVMQATGLDIYHDRLATKLSGGNQRKLALAIALMGNPSVILVDEYSTGIDAKMKRELWAVLKQATSDKSVLLTTHSMEEASYLATKVGIISQRMLAIGTPDDLASRNESYEVHFSCQTREEFLKVQQVMAKMPGARMVDDVATRFEVPLGAQPEFADSNSKSITSVASIFEILSREKDFPEFTVGKSSLETAFIRVINSNSSEQ